MSKSKCPECGLAFTHRSRTFSTFTRPAVNLEEHLAYHAEESARAAELEKAMRAQNELSRVEAHLPEAQCEKRCREAEDQSAIRLPVVVPSRSTMARANEAAVLLDELPLPLPSKLARHRSIYGSGGLDFLPEDGSVPKLRSKRTRRRRATRAEVSGAA